MGEPSRPVTRRPCVQWAEDSRNVRFAAAIVTTVTLLVVVLLMPIGAILTGRLTIDEVEAQAWPLAGGIGVPLFGFVMFNWSWLLNVKRKGRKMNGAASLASLAVLCFTCLGLLTFLTVFLTVKLPLEIVGPTEFKMIDYQYWPLSMAVRLINIPFPTLITAIFSLDLWSVSSK